MKLRTQCHEAHGYPVFYTASRPDVERDAAYAHALVRAITEFKTSSSESYEDLVADQIENRADELMAQWGYREE